MLRRFCVSATLALLCIAAIAAPAQTYTTLASFDGKNGFSPSWSLVQGLDGNYYGATALGGANTNCNLGCGVIFKITSGGRLTTLYNFCSEANCADGFEPANGLMLSSDGNFYGTTYHAGRHGGGTIFSVTPTGVLTTLYSFCAQANCADGAAPQGGLTQGADGRFYGTTSSGGPSGAGTIFRIDRSGNLKTLHGFCSQANCADGSSPGAVLVEDLDGNFYGTTFFGANTTGICASLGCGTIFRITPGGMLTILHTFTGPDGGNPYSAPILGADGIFYGTTSGGGVGGGLCEGGCGTVFKMTPAGKLTVLYSFTGAEDGNFPLGALLQGTDGKLYGTTVGGGDPNVMAGTIFTITPAGSLTTLYSFCRQTACFDGGADQGGLIQGTDGEFYGAPSGGGEGGDGTVFRLGMGLCPFVSFVRNSGKVGQTEQILGQGFRGTTRVSFNGTTAAFTVKSDTYLTATVPAGATTGFVTVATLGGTLNSNKTFRVVPQVLSFSPTSGPVGTRVVIKGKSFTGASVLTFACKWKMSFTVDSDTQITAIIPAAATSGTNGTIAVRTPGGRVESTARFTVTD
jgi:uncharacterized repeat protein (TIGR03803 family)